jgi:hypothetical protein
VIATTGLPNVVLADGESGVGGRSLDTIRAHGVLRDRARRGSARQARAAAASAGTKG